MKFFAGFSILFFLGCQSSPKIKYSFFIAGHAYGNPKKEGVYLHPPFSGQFVNLNQDKHLEFGILTGDIVHYATEENWGNVQRQLAQLNIKVHLAPGNHDVANRALFNKYYKQSFYSFNQGNDLFIILDPNISNWNIDGEQLAFLKKTLTEKGPQATNVFVFFHQLIWWKDELPYNKWQPNSFQGKADTLNFHSHVFPLFKSLKKPIFMFAGDVGAFAERTSIVYHQMGKTALVASGMGGEKADNFLMVNVLESGAVEIRIIGLNCEAGTDCMGKLTDYLFE